MTISFFFIILASLIIALWSKRGHARQGARAFFTASGQFGPILFFFLSVGETYSVTSMLGFPGGVFAKGDTFVLWFFGYILIAAPIVYFVGPLIWHAGALYGSATIPDFFGSHFESRTLESVIALSALVLLVPVGTTQFLGLGIVLASLDLPVPPLLLLSGAGVLAFLYVAIAGLRASAFVAVLKDVLMILAILLVSGIALAHWPAPIPKAAIAAPRTDAVQRDLVFALSTMIVQGVGFAMIPQTWAFVFSARSPTTIRRAQIFAPLYLTMFPLLMVVAYYAQRYGLRPPTPDYVFITTARALLPPGLTGVVLAAITLSGLVVLSGACLAIGPLVTRNLVPGLDTHAQRRWALVVTGVYLLSSIIGTRTAPHLIVTLNNIFYFGIAQSVPGFVAALCLPRVRASGVIAGMLAGYALTLVVFLWPIDVGGLNAGLVGLALNIAVMLSASALDPRRDGPTVLAKLRSRRAGSGQGES